MLKTGKLDNEVLKRIVIDQISYKRPEVKVRAGIGEDCAVVGYGDYDCVISTDPITAAIKDIGRLAIHISCNDVASNGVQPLGITLAVMLPEGITEEEVETMMKQAGKAAEAAEVEIVGGHTEVTPAVKQPVIVSTAFGRASSGESQSARAMKPGDAILLTKTAGLEGTGILASDFEEELSQVLSREEIARAKGLLDHVSVVKEGVLAGKIGTSGMHDVTEGGVLGAVWEMCRISGLGAEIIEEEIPVEPVTKKISAHFGIDVLRLISSGCMLIMAPAEKKARIMEAVSAAGIEISCIGRVCPKQEGLSLVHKDGAREEIAPPAADELYKVVR